MRRAGRVLLLLVAAVAGYYLLLFVAQRWLLFPAPRGAWGAPLPADAQPVEFGSPSGPGRAWFLAPLTPGAGPTPVIVFFHGNGERGEQWLLSFGPPRRAGMGVLVVEYPGYGEAPGAPTQASVTDVALAAFDWLRARPGQDSAPVIAYGRSLGGAAATRLATRRPVAALVLESTFTSVRAYASRYLAPPFLVRDPFDTLGELTAYRGPLLVAHGDHDVIAPPAHGRTLAAAHPNSTFVAMPCGHNDCEQPWPEILAFIKRHLVLAA